jgi:hypothetical protein
MSGTPSAFLDFPFGNLPNSIFFLSTNGGAFEFVHRDNEYSKRNGMEFGRFGKGEVKRKGENCFGEDRLEL